MANACKVVKQIETPHLPDPIIRRPCADREEKRVPHANETAEGIRTDSLSMSSWVLTEPKSFVLFQKLRNRHIVRTITGEIEPYHAVHDV